MFWNVSEGNRNIAYFLSIAERQLMWSKCSNSLFKSFFNITSTLILILFSCFGDFNCNLTSKWYFTSNMTYLKIGNFKTLFFSLTNALCSLVIWNLIFNIHIGISWNKSFRFILGATFYCRLLQRHNTLLHYTGDILFWFHFIVLKSYYRYRIHALYVILLEIIVVRKVHYEIYEYSRSALSIRG